jgi:hypothetical protein
MLQMWTCGLSCGQNDIGETRLGERRSGRRDVIRRHKRHPDQGAFRVVRWGLLSIAETQIQAQTGKSRQYTDDTQETTANIGRKQSFFVPAANLVVFGREARMPPPENTIIPKRTEKTVQPIVHLVFSRVSSRDGPKRPSFYFRTIPTASATLRSFHRREANEISRYSLSGPSILYLRSTMIASFSVRTGQNGQQKIIPILDTTHLRHTQ